MKKSILFLLIAPFLLLGCTQTEAGENGDPATPTQPPILIRGDLENYLPAPEDFQDTYSLLSSFPISNQSIMDNYTADYVPILNQSGREEGIGAFFDLASPSSSVPTQIFVVIESFSSIDGANTFFDYDFPDEFRNTRFDTVPMDLSAADEANITTMVNRNGDDPNSLIIAVAFRYRNIMVLVEGRGTRDNVPEDYVKSVAMTILDQLAN